LTSHETVCLLNTSDQDAHVEITVFYTDREPGGPYRITVPARRTRPVRFNDLSDPEPIPSHTDFASVIEADVPSEEHPPNDLVRYAQRTEEVGFSFALISDHFHPWIDRQAQSSNVIRDATTQLKTLVSIRSHVP